MGVMKKGNWNNLLRRLGINQKFPELQEVSINTIDNIISEITDFLDTPNLDNENKYLDDSFLKKYNFPHNYWSERGLSEETIENFELGYDPLTNAGIIPLRTYNGHLLGVIRRRFDPDANIKYLYPKGFSKASYLFWRSPIQFWWISKPKHEKAQLFWWSCISRRLNRCYVFLGCRHTCFGYFGLKF